MSTNQENKNIIIYQSKDGQVSFNVNVFEETVWLTQQQMAELFGRDRTVIAKHIRNIFKEGELQEKVVCANFAHTTKHGAIKGKEQNVDVKYYNLDVIISVGYRVKSARGTQFRIWANQIIKQYLINGYAVNETRIKQMNSSIDELVKSNKLVREDVIGIKNLLIKLIERPIVIHSHSHNQITLTNSKLEDKAIELLNQLIKQLKFDTKLKTELEEIKQDLKISPKDKKTKSKIINFFNKLGDSHSDVHKTIKGAGVAGKIIKELVKLGEKLKDLIS